MQKTTPFILTFFISIACSHKKSIDVVKVMPREVAETAVVPITGCRVHLKEEYLDLDNCFKKKNKDGTFTVKTEIMDKIDFKTLTNDEKTVTYYDFSRTQEKNKIHSKTVTGYIVKSGKARDVVFFDNGPDYFEEGLARIVDANGKTAFINTRLKVVIPGLHDFASPFRDRRAYYCDKCVSESLVEHPEIQGGLWGIMDKKGRSRKGPMSKEEMFQDPNAPLD